MRYTITAPQQFKTTITPPASKSISNRALIIHAMNGEHQLPDNLSDCDDTEVILRALKDKPAVIDIKAAGTAMRFMTAFLSVNHGTHTITGTERMRHRPIAVLVDALRELGAHINYVGEEGYPPLRITGEHIDGGYIEVEGNISSQYISALLLIAPYLKKGLELKLHGHIISRPYIDMTLSIMQEFGADVNWTAANVITVKPIPYKAKAYTIENDWSAASYWYEMIALHANPDSEIKLIGLYDASRQGDAVVRYIFSLLGVKTAFSTENGTSIVTLHYKKTLLKRLDYDFSNSPDLAQTVVVTCCALGIPFHFTGLSTLKIKETDRIEALKNELLKVGYIVRSRNDSELIWDGETIRPSMLPIETYDDHRMALAFAPLAIKTGHIEIDSPNVVTKSYPHYWDDLTTAGFGIRQIE